jgi:hypothetical protein
MKLFDKILFNFLGKDYFLFLFTRSDIQLKEKQKEILGMFIKAMTV